MTIEEQLQYILTNAWDKVCSERPAQWRLLRAQPYEASLMKLTYFSAKEKYFLSLRKNNLVQFENTCALLLESALYGRYQELVFDKRMVKHRKYLKAHYLAHETRQRETLLYDLREHVLSNISKHMGAGYVFINSAYADWLGGLSLLRATLGNTYKIIENPFIHGVIADNTPHGISLVSPMPTLEVKEGNLIIGYQFNFTHSFIERVLVMRDEIQANWKEEHHE